MAKRSVDDTSLAELADAIRAKGGTSDPLVFPDGFVGAVEEIQADGGGYPIETFLEKSLSGIIDITATKLSGVGNFTDYKQITGAKIHGLGDFMYTSGVLQGCISLEFAEFPGLTRLNGCANFLKGCTALKRVLFQDLTKMDNYTVCSDCTALEVLDFQASLAGFPGSFALSNCTSLKALIVRKTSAIVTLSASSPFSSCSIGTGDGYIYVPSALLDTYKAATNWAQYADQFLAIEGSEYE